MRGIGIGRGAVLASAGTGGRVLALCWAVLSGIVPAQEPGPVPTQPRPALHPRVLRQTAFNIPFSVDGSLKVIEVQLFVSTDQGATWQFYARRHPSAGHFPFRAQGDGAFWFASRTVDQTLRPPDIKNLRPELYVIVDTVEPSFAFEATVGEGGEINSSWRISDPTLDPDSLKVQYQPRIGQAWKPVSAEQKQETPSAGQLVGSMNWRPEGAGHTLNLKAEVADRAGNKAVVTRLLFLPTKDARRQSLVSAVPPADPFSAMREQSESPAVWPPNAQSPPPDQRRPPTDAPHADHAATIPTTTRLVAKTAELETGASDAPRINDANRVALPPGERPRMTRAKRFQLDYAIDAVGPSGVKQVELWGTRDGGRTWSVWNIDEDRKSPVEVAVQEDGLFGFQVVVVGNNGLAGPAPRNGDLADLWVGVDTTAPQVRLMSVIYGEGSRAGQLDIRWTASDTRLAERPIVLSFSDQPAGPWTTIAAGLPNSGQYYWSIDPRVPKRLFLRIEVRDEAGNHGEHRLDEPIAMASLIPKARIQGIRPSTKP